MLFYWMWPKFASDIDETGADEFATLGQCDPVTIDQVNFLRKARRSSSDRPSEDVPGTLPSAA